MHNDRIKDEQRHLEEFAKMVKKLTKALSKTVTSLKTCVEDEGGKLKHEELYIELVAEAEEMLINLNKKN